MQKMTSLCGIGFDEISSLLVDAGFDTKYATIISNSFYKKKISDFSDMHRLPIRLREYLNKVTVSGLFPPISSEISVDHSVKCLYKNERGLLYETVYIPEEKRNTVCVSIQSGCRMGCAFCATARYGFHGNLSVSDVINQIMMSPLPGKITHVVFMGMGEPLDNIDVVLKSIDILNAEWGMSIGKHNVTVSSVGVLPVLRRLVDEASCNITISMFSPFHDERIRYMPIENKTHLSDVMDLLKATPLEKGRKITVAYMLLKGINDDDAHLSALISLLKGSKVKVNLLRYHQLPDKEYSIADEERVESFKDGLLNAAIITTIRKSRGNDISAACGLLASDLK